MLKFKSNPNILKQYLKINFIRNVKDYYYYICANYIISINKDFEKYLNILNTTIIGDKMVSIAETKINEGKRIGLKEGLNKGSKKTKIETTIKMFKKNYLPTEVSEITTLSMKEVLDLKKKL
jgi:hypothetical protein